MEGQIRHFTLLVSMLVVIGEWNWTMPGPPGGDHEHVRLPADASEVLGSGMRHRHCGVLPEEHLRHWLSHQVAPTDHHRARALEADPRDPQELHAPSRRAGTKTWPPHGEQARVHRMQPVHVFLRSDAIEHRLRVQVVRQGKLDEDPVDPLVRVQGVDPTLQFSL